MRLARIYKIACPFLYPRLTHVYLVGREVCGLKDTGWRTYESLAAVYRAAHKLGFTHAITPQNNRVHRIPAKYRED